MICGIEGNDLDFNGGRLTINFDWADVKLQEIKGALEHVGYRANLLGVTARC